MALIERFGHGGDLHTASDVFGVEKKDLVDFSANINPLGPPAILMDRLKRELENIIHYPDPDHRVFRQLLGDKLGVNKECILVGNGAAECMALAIQSLSPKRVGVIYPCFSEYMQFALKYGASVKGCYGKEENNFKPEWEDFQQLIDQCDLVFIGHPNNPTGMAYQLDELKMMAIWAQEADTYLVIDEAFLDFVLPEQQNTLVFEIENYPKLLILRSMTKFYAIPGLRLGFAVGNPDLINRIKQNQITWSVNHLALTAGEVCLNLADYEIKTRQLIIQERAFLLEFIRNQLNWRVWPSEANFLLIRLPGDLLASDLQLMLGRKGIMIRDCSMYPGLTNHDFRIAVKSRLENLRLLQTLRELVEAKG